MSVLYHNAIVGVTRGGGGGGGIPILTRQEWESLSKAQKQGYGLVAVQDADSGFDRGELYYGADYSAILQYIRTNYSDFSITLTNWEYDLGDTWELVYKQVNAPNAMGNWPGVIGTAIGSTAKLYLQYNLWNNRRVMNLSYNGSYSGDAYVSFDSPYDYSNYYKIRCEAGNFTILKGASLDDISTTAATRSFASASGGTGQPVILFPLNNPSRTDNNFYSLTVWNGGVKIHEYLPIENGVTDTVTEDEYTVSTTGHINGPMA